MLRTFCVGLALALGLGGVVNGVFMLVSPAAWYFTVPGVTTTGPFNQHFIRDIGLIFLLLGGAFIAGAALPRYRVAAWAVTSLWLAGHALFHLWEVAVGICGPSAIPRDFPAVTLPAIFGALLTFWAIADARSTPQPTQENDR